MGTFTDTLDPVPASLPQWLQHQALEHGTDVALRHKHLGVWQEQSWAHVADEVRRFASALQARGFAAGATLTIISRPRPQALLAALAAQWLGGVASLFDPLETAAEQVQLLGTLQPDFVLVEGLEEMLRLHAAQVAARVLVYLDKRGLADSTPFAQALDYAALAAEPPIVDLASEGQVLQTAFVFYRASGRATEEQRVSHAELLQEGQRLVTREGLGRQEEALAARAFASGGQARYLLAPWLIAGFRLNFPENLATRDRDRRELGPTLVAGTRETYERLYRYALERLPAPGSWSRGLVDWALTAHPDVLQRHLGDWLVRRPLRDVLGFSRTRAPLLVGDALPPETQAFFQALGIAVRQWDDGAHWQATPNLVQRTTDDWTGLQSQLA
ncbi:AMP-binding enzyme [Pseudomonas sp. NFACC23-1]|uniref:AMP-binding protein n=1 Tax=unclassified Pseudomonas TaxID=196821 RepID=UPI000880DA7B|nr:MULTISPECIES: AMP-binding protein [unclassified Pseudomonas]SDB33717.1 AMP-binding enzyme [Pseudomonas sp. NFACC17-2]SEJ49612.1 AMP-binding enzyme [Pseudomonas sp. NFACC23-1]SFW70355.1 AMP-binding enzyme [Pseudomonas sp. NFACC16-2]